MDFDDLDVLVVGLDLKSVLRSIENDVYCGSYLYWANEVSETTYELWQLSLELVTVVSEGHEAWGDLALELDK